MILKNKIFFILPFIIACFVNCSVSANTDCSAYSQQQCGTHTDCEWSGDFDTGRCIQIEPSEPSEPSESNICNILSHDECNNNNCCKWFSLSTATDDDDENGKCLLKPNSGSDCTVDNCSPNEYYNVSGCVACPSEYPESLGGIRNPKTKCYKSCNGTTYYYDDGQTVPCSCLTTPGACDLSRCANDISTGCSSCNSGKYLDTDTHTCKSCPDNFPNSDAAAIGINACYQSCDACNNASDIRPMCESITGPKVYPNSDITECRYKYNCAAGYYSNMSATNYSTNVSCQSCNNLPKDKDAAYTDYGATRPDECPWILTCDAGYVYDTDEKKCKQCPNATSVSWYKNTTPLSITYRFNGSYISATDDDNPSHNGTEQDDNLPYCDGNVFTVTLNNTPYDEIIANSDELETTKIYFKYNAPIGQMWYYDNNLEQPINNDNKLKTPISWGDFNGYYIQRTDTKVFDYNGTPVNNPQIITTNNVTLDANYKTPDLTYHAKIVAGEGDSNANRCPEACSKCTYTGYTGNDIQCKLPQDNYDGYDITFDENNRYEALDKTDKSLGYIQRDSQSNNILKFVPTTVDALITMRSTKPYIYISPKLCPEGYYCQNFTKTQCPAGRTTDAGAKSPDDCKVITTFDNSTKFQDTYSSFYLPIAHDNSVKMATKLQNKLNGEQSQNP